MSIVVQGGKKVSNYIIINFIILLYSPLPPFPLPFITHDLLEDDLDPLEDPPNDTEEEEEDSAMPPTKNHVCTPPPPLPLYRPT